MTIKVMPNGTPVPVWPVTVLRFGEEQLRVAWDGELHWFALEDVEAILPQAAHLKADIDEEDLRLRVSIGTPDRFFPHDLVSAMGLIEIATLASGSTTPGDHDYLFRRWLRHEALPKLGVQGVPRSPRAPDYVAASVILGGPKDEADHRNRLLAIIRREPDVSLARLTIKSPGMRSVDRRKALADLVELGAITSTTSTTGGRPALMFRVAGGQQ